MARVGPFKRNRLPDPVRRRLDTAGATAWEALVETHADHALRFVSLMEGRLAFDEAISRYLDETDLRDPIASSVRSRVLVALEADMPTRDARVSPAEQRAGETAADRHRSGPETGGLRRFRPDVVVKGITRKVRATEEVEQLVALAIARAEEAVLRVHIENAVSFSAITRRHGMLQDAVEDYIDLMRITGGRAQAVFQRTMARLADLHLPDGRGNGRRS